MGDNFKTPEALKVFSSSSVYSVVQDKKGAIWLNTNKGLCRFNGNDVDFLSSPMLGTAAVYDGSQSVFAASSKWLSKYDIDSRKRINNVVTSGSLSNCNLAASEDSVFIALKDKVYLQDCDSTTLLFSLPDSIEITTLLYGLGKSLLIGTKGAGLFNFENGRLKRLFQSEDDILSLHSDRSGRIWVGFRKGGVSCMDPFSGNISESYDSLNGIPFSSVRSISTDSNSNVYFATVKGLFKIHRNGVVEELMIDGAYGYPFRCVYVDRDDNVWAGSYYNGVYYSNNYSYPFTDLPFEKDIRLSKGLVRDVRGNLWLFTDNFGAYRSSDGARTWTQVRGSTGIKYQGAFYDESRNEVWTSDYQGDLMCYSLPSMRCRRYPVAIGDNPSEYFGPMVKRGSEMYLGGINGVYVFNPMLEDKVTRRIPGVSSRVFDLENGPDGKLWIAADGLYVSDGRTAGPYSALRLHMEPSTFVTDISFDQRGRLWAACVGQGVVLVEDGKTVAVMQRNTGLPDNHVSFVEPFGNGMALVGTSNGIAIIDSDKMTSYNYNSSNGLSLSSGRWACTCRMPDGTILVGGSDGIEMMDPSEFNPSGHMPVPIIDRIDVNGEVFDCNIYNNKTIDLSCLQSNFTIATASFDYSKVAAVNYEYKLEGYEQDWTKLGPSSEVDYRNMAPGKYNFVVRARRGGSAETYGSVRIIVHPAWYATVAAKAGFSFLVVSLTLLLLYFLYSKAILSERLAARERENEEKTRFFVDISYQLRTPLNLIIGQLETFFRNYGARTAGITDIQDVYGKAKMMRSLISDYVDMQNDAVENESQDPAVAEAVEDSKFLNASIGAVERNLYAGKLDISVLCRELSVGKTTLTARLRKVCGMTPRQFIEDIRLKHAAKMLQDGAMRVSEVSDRLGFSSPRYFSKCFKAKFGTIPSEYRPE